MSLISFHKFLIATGIIFCLGFSIWELASYRATGHLWAAVIGGSFGLAALGLAYYLTHLSRFLGIPMERSELTRELEDSLSSNGRQPPKSKQSRTSVEAYESARRDS